MRGRKDIGVLNLGVGDRESTTTWCWCQHLDLWSSNILPTCCQILMSVVWPMSLVVSKPSWWPTWTFQGLWLLYLCWLSYSIQSSGGTMSSSFSLLLRLLFHHLVLISMLHVHDAIEINLGLNSNRQLLTMILLSGYLRSGRIAHRTPQTCASTTFW